MRIFSRIFFLPMVVWLAPLAAIPYQWEPRSGESAFTVDVPEGWRTWESVKKNGVIAQFRRRDARIEVRSFAGKETLTVAQIVNQKAARLSSEYTYVRLIEEKDSRFRENLHLSVWEIRRKNRSYREETAVVISDHGPVVVSCVIPMERYADFRTHCENAFYSLVLDAEKTDSGQRTKADIVSELAKIQYSNVPGSLPVIAPDTLMGVPAAAPKPAGQIQYDDNYILPDSGNR